MAATLKGKEAQSWPMGNILSLEKVSSQSEQLEMG